MLASITRPISHADWYQESCTYLNLSEWCFYWSATFHAICFYELEVGMDYYLLKIDFFIACGALFVHESLQAKNRNRKRKSLTSLAIILDISFCSSNFQSKVSSLFERCFFVDWKIKEIQENATPKTFLVKIILSILPRKFTTYGQCFRYMLQLFWNRCNSVRHILFCNKHNIRQGPTLKNII